MQSAWNQWPGVGAQPAGFGQAYATSAFPTVAAVTQSVAATAYQPAMVPGATYPFNAQQQQLQQWEQWQQQYLQWQQQYGDKYQGPMGVPNNMTFPAAAATPIITPVSSSGAENVTKDTRIGNVDTTKRPTEFNDSKEESKKPKTGKTSKSESLDDLIEQERTFDVQYKDWEESFRKWKEQNANHPDKAQYKEYESKMETYREQLLQKREQLKKKRETKEKEMNAAAAAAREAALATSSMLNPPPMFGTNQMASNNFVQNQMFQMPTMYGSQEATNTSLQPPPSYGGNFPMFNVPPPNISIPPTGALDVNKNTADKNESLAFLSPLAGTNASIPGLDLVGAEKSVPSSVSGSAIPSSVIPPSSTLFQQFSQDLTKPLHTSDDKPFDFPTPRERGFAPKPYRDERFGATNRPPYNAYQSPFGSGAAGKKPMEEYKATSAAPVETSFAAEKYAKYLEDEYDDSRFRDPEPSESPRTERHFRNDHTGGRQSYRQNDGPRSGSFTNRDGYEHSEARGGRGGPRGGGGRGDRNGRGELGGRFGERDSGSGSGSFGDRNSGPGADAYSDQIIGPGASRHGEHNSKPGAGQFGEPNILAIGGRGEKDSGPSVGRFDSSGPLARRLNEPNSGPSAGQFGEPMSGPGAGRFGEPGAGPGAGRFGESVSGHAGRFGESGGRPGAGRFGEPNGGPVDGRFGELNIGPGGRFNESNSGSVGGRFGERHGGSGASRFGEHNAEPGTGRFGEREPGGRFGKRGSGGSRFSDQQDERHVHRELPEEPNPFGVKTIKVADKDKILKPSLDAKFNLDYEEFIPPPEEEVPEPVASKPVSLLDMPMMKPPPGIDEKNLSLFDDDEDDSKASATADKEPVHNINWKTSNKMLNKSQDGQTATINSGPPSNFHQPPYSQSRFESSRINFSNVHQHQEPKALMGPKFSNKSSLNANGIGVSPPEAEPSSSPEIFKPKSIYEYNHISTNFKIRSAYNGPINYFEYNHGKNKIENTDDAKNGPKINAADSWKEEEPKNKKPKLSENSPLPPRDRKPSTEQIENTEKKEEIDEKSQSSRRESDSKLNETKTVTAASPTKLIEDLLLAPGRNSRPDRILIVLRGPPGSGKTFIAKLIKDKEVELGGSAPRILSLDDYFTVEVDKEEVDPVTKKTTTKKEMEYEYEAKLEPQYQDSLVKSLKKNITDGFFSFMIVDCVNDKLKKFEEMCSFASSKGFEVFVCEMDMDLATCAKRNVHKRTEKDISDIIDKWEKTPSSYTLLDVRSFLQSVAITDVEMEEAPATAPAPTPGAPDAPIVIDGEESEEGEKKDESVDKSETDSKEDECIVTKPLGLKACRAMINRSKWESPENTEDNLDRLDGISKRKNTSIKEWLELSTEESDFSWYFADSKTAADDSSAVPRKKRVRWADLEERMAQQKMRDIGFVVGQTDWNRMMDPTFGGNKLTQTKYIFK